MRRNDCQALCGIFVFNTNTLLKARPGSSISKLMQNPALGVIVAKLSELVGELAWALGVKPQNTVTIARTLRSERLLSTSGRGSGGADMTVDDCANLLIGSISGYRANKCYSAIGDAKVIFFNPEHDNHFIEDDPISEPFLTGDLGQLYQAGSFYDHLRIIIASSYDGTLSAYFDTLEKMNRIPNISINVNRRGAEMSAGIYVNSFDSIGDNRLGTGYTHHSSEYHAGDGAVRKWLNGGGPDGNGITRDLGITQTISEFTIIHLGKVLRNEIEFKRAEKV